MKKYGKFALNGIWWIAGKMMLIALIAVVSFATNIMMDHNGLIPVDIRWLVAYTDDFEVKNVSIQWETADSVVVKWKSLYFEILDTPESHDIILQGKVETETTRASGWQYYPIATSTTSTEAGYGDLGGEIPNQCFGINGDLYFSEGLETFFLEYPLGSEEDVPSLCYWKADRYYVP